jgi:ABC-type multidrug transport system fused ATPase/permease subunit
MFIEDSVDAVIRKRYTMSKGNKAVSFYKRRNSWVRRRWLDFRQGHTIYLVFAMTFLNFITIQYALLIDRVPVLSSIFSMWTFAIIFLVAYVPLAIVIGYWHRKSQWKIEQEAMFSENVVQARLWLFMINLVEGKVTEEEREEMREMLKKIIKKLPKEPPSKKSDAEAS